MIQGLLNFLIKILHCYESVTLFLTKVTIQEMTMSMLVTLCAPAIMLVKDLLPRSNNCTCTCTPLALFNIALHQKNERAYYQKSHDILFCIKVGWEGD